ncbi:D-alanyl-D-alanine carboxypeptidase family protein [Ancylobacter sp. IITR112]|uniref:D-alanyl-D-alanine carboxypeptidase family protein n=1 Tax=Ancylobacter sp. IITR112 TaxID=3138073 RepID=UPI00352A95CF
MNLSLSRPARRAVRWLAAALLVPLLLAPLAAQATPSLVIDVDSGKVLLAEEATKPWYPASITKLMTAYVTFKAIRAGRLTPETLITVSETAAAQKPSKMGFKVGTQVTVDNALKMMLVKSANDMAVVLAEGVGGSLPAFVAEMNATAAELGMNGTHYANPNGLPDPEQVSTARDLAILARAIFLNFPEQADLFRIPAIKLGPAVIRSYNKLIDRYPGADGMKTGFICASGFNLVASATRGNRHLLAVVLGTDSGKARTEEAALLLERGFQQQGSIFGSIAPSVESLRNEPGAPTDMRAQVCGGKRKNTASEADDDSGPAPTGFVAAGMPQLGENVTGASLLQKLPPSMPPVEVFVGPFPSAEALAAAYPPPPAPKKPANAKKPGDKKGQATAIIDPADPSAPGAPTPKPKPKPATAQATTGAKPAAKPATKPASKPAPKPAAAPAAPMELAPPQ